MVSWRRIAALFVLFPLTLGLYLSLKEGIAAVLMEGVTANVRHWMENQSVLDDPVWKDVQGFTRKALSFSPNDPQLLQTAGAVYWWGAWQSRADTTASADLLEASLDHYRKSVAARPAWPDAWLYLASAKHWGEQWDDEFQRAFFKAWQLGGWRREIVWGLSELGLDSWSRLSSENRKRFQAVLERAANDSHRRLYELAAAKEMTFIVCLSLSDHEPTRSYCGSKGNKKPGGG